MAMKNGINRENLQKLATFLAYGELPKEVKFDMSDFCHNGGSYDFVAKPPCGTAACAVGFAPFAGIRKFTKEDFEDYSERTLISFRINYVQWAWCFSGKWEYVDNTPKGAAKRIQYLLDKGIEKWDECVDEDAKKLYARTKVKE